MASGVEAKGQSQPKNLIFVVGSTIERDGVPEDLTKIKLLEGPYNAQIIDLMDKTKVEYKTYFSNLKKDKDWLEKFRQCNFVFVICMCHGDTDGQIKSKDEIIQLKCYFLNPFFSIEQLDGKLKWLVVQSCRGSLKSDAMDADGKSKRKYLDRFMVSYCTTEGMVSEQYNKNGKIFIQYLCEELADNANKNNYKTSLFTMMENIIEKVRQYGIDQNISDYPVPEYIKNFYDHFFVQ
ncbi:uncharacterized protein LOC119603192 [Lucilia sericata]|uniref:uncharacterized protein LOC119603192 n=1 Tax=Lucilia sericata TaxID=13632 RepID=UPI0018A7E91B|nr:uncharacterized protein LOC119603192 [Lucilia sericata]XP_037811075.1 uncharacterized protein LOC119603192 [Lucilia sericata]